MAWHLDNAKPLSEPTLEILIEIYTYQWRKIHMKIAAICLSHNVLKDMHFHETCSSHSVNYCSAGVPN